MTRVRVEHRIAAKAIDLGVMAFIAALLPYPLGPLLGFTYSVLADAACFWKFNGQSIGKKVMGLRVVHQKTLATIRVRESLLRNAPVGVATFFAIIPLWGWLLLGLVGLPLMAIEIYLMIRVETGYRLGDVMGDTKVIYVAEGRSADRNCA